MQENDRMMYPAAAEDARLEVMHFAEEQRKGFVGGLVAVAAFFTMAVSDIFPQLLFIHNVRSLLSLFGHTVLSGVGMLLLFQAGKRRGYLGRNSVVSEMRDRNFSVVKFRIADKRETRGIRPVYVMTDENGSNYRCTTYMAYRDAAIGDVMYGVVCANGFGFVPRSFTRLVEEQKRMTELQTRLGELPAAQPAALPAAPQVFPDTLVPLPEMPELDAPADALLMPELPVYRKPEQPGKVSLKKED